MGGACLQPAEVSQLAVVAFPPGEHLPIDGECRGVPATCNVHTDAAVRGGYAGVTA